jgi:ABC-type iron transport system FetAB permease component
MTGQIIGGAPIMDAVKYQQIIMFMISASTALGVLSSIFVSTYLSSFTIDYKQFIHNLFTIFL